jgi:prolyl-tRNA editing enzyme YbaK/EbsC (Cys-tRNA(Pro) deacylase)
MKTAIFESIKDLLNKNSIAYKEIHHQPTFTSEESAQARGEDISIGGKAILMKVDKHYKLFVLSASLKIDSAAIKKYFQAKKLRFASSEELHELTGLVPGAIPPFGKPILPLELFVDTSILANKKIAFNAGSLTDSIILSVDDYLKVAQPTIFDFSRT